MADAALRRRAMLDGQLRPNRLTDERLQRAILEVPRERFVPAPLRAVAYVDEDLPIGFGRHLMEPRVFARLLQAAEFGAQDVALDVGCATGYSTAVEARVVATVVALECEPEFVRAATENLAALGADNVAVVAGDLPPGYPEQAPYDVIVLNGSVERVPEALLGQLAEGGRLVGVETGGGAGRGVLYLKRGGLVGRRVLFDAAVPPLPGFQQPRGFVF
jgi:protein-L-isoaspartate(D-aspartate) O-methyltransferase